VGEDAKRSNPSGSAKGGDPPTENAPEEVVVVVLVVASGERAKQNTF
jgi:hypothetical protein